MIDTIKQFIREILLPKYWATPCGRGVAHFNAVCADAKRLMGRELSDRELLAIALHDIGVGRPGFDRDDHPFAALVALRQDGALYPLKGMVDAEMAFAIQNHMRDQYRECGLIGDLHTLLVEADEGCPKWGHERLMKPIRYWLDGRNGKLTGPFYPAMACSDIEKVAEHVLKVVRFKVDDFGSGQPPFTPRFCRVFAEEIEHARDWAGQLRLDGVVAVVETALRDEYQRKRKQ